MRGSQNMFELPARMRADVIRRRGDEGAYVPPQDGLDGYLKRQHDVLRLSRGFLKQALVNPRSDQELVAQMQQPEFDDPAQASPLQAALSVALVRGMAGRLKPEFGFVESWVLGRGHTFAFRALAELYDVHATYQQVGNRTSDHAFLRGVNEDMWIPDLWLLARRLLELLAGASEAEYREVEAAAQEYRDGRRPQRGLTSFLFRDRTDWVDADIADLITAQQYQQDLTYYFVVSSLTRAEQVAEFAARQRWLSWPRHAGPVETVLAAVGADTLPLLLPWLDAPHQDERPKLLALIAEFGSDDAIRALIDRVDQKDGQQALLATGDRFPGPTLRLLAEADGSAGAADGWFKQVDLALRLLANAHAEAARAEIPKLGSAARGRLSAALDPPRELPAAGPDSLPAILVSPPWKNPVAAAKPVVIKGLTATREASVAWAPGERERWSASPIYEQKYRDEPEDAALADLFAKREPFRGSVNTPRFVCRAPDELVRPLLDSGWQPTYLPEANARVFLARFEVLALPATQYSKPHERMELIGPFRSPETALFAADSFSRVKSLRAAAAKWLARHPAYAAEQLIPVALGKPGKDRQSAVQTLRWLGAKTGTGVVVIATEAYGEAAAAAIKTLMESDGSEDIPRTMPSLPLWAEPYALPQIARAEGGSALPDEAVRHVVQMLTISKPDAPYPGIAAVREACDAALLRDFAWTLFENWQLAGYPSAHAWAFDGLRWFGDDASVVRLAPLIRAWPGESGHARAVTGLDVLAAIGTDAALAALYGISQRVKFKGLKDRAAEKIAEIAEALELTADELGDRLVPDLGLDPDGSLVLDFGPRRFVVGFDELLKPYVRDEAGKRLKALPKPGVNDDSERAKAATEAFSALKKDARSVTADQIARLEQSMCLRRRWSAADFRAYFVAHPLLRHLVRRLVWGSYDAEGNLLATFRIAEDLTFATVEDEPFPDERDVALVGLVHPLEFAELIPRWSDVLADYEILQPFAQLGRETYALTDAEGSSANLTRFRGIDIPVGKLVGLTRRGWRRGQPWDNGVETHLLRPLPGGRALIVNIDPGIQAGMVAESGDQELSDVWIARDGVADWFPRDGAGDLFGTLDAVTASEILRDLTSVTEGMNEVTA